LNGLVDMPAKLFTWRLTAVFNGYFLLVSLSNSIPKLDSTDKGPTYQLLWQYVEWFGW